MDDISRELFLNTCVNIHSTEALKRLLRGLCCGYDYNGLSYSMVYVKGDHDYLMHYKDSLRRIYYNCLDVLDYRTNGDDERKAVV